MYSIDSRFYSPSVRGKPGELAALRDLDPVSRSRLLPDIVAAPLSQAENPSGSINAAILAHVGKLTANWAPDPCLFDPRFLKFNSDDKGSDAAAISMLLQRMRDFGARPMPVVALNSDTYRSSAMSGHAKRTGSGVALRVALDDLNNLQPLEDQLKLLGLPPSDCIILLDLSKAVIQNNADFRENFLHTHLGRLQGLGEWKKIVVQASAYPTRKNPCPQKGEVELDRTEWQIWRELVRSAPELVELVMFGDFGADHGRIDFGDGGRVIPHFRYKFGDKWLIVRGTEEFASIRGVADRLLKSGKFHGARYSAGDEFIYACAQRYSRTGTASDWRSANMNHHFTEVVDDLGDLLGVAIVRAEREERLFERELFD